jgi:hypothetical protein
MVELFNSSIFNFNKRSLYICAAGFENRVRGIIENLPQNDNINFQYSFILQYNTHIKDNLSNLEYLEKKLGQLSLNRLLNVVIDIENLLLSFNNLKHNIALIEHKNLDTIYIDISGMTNFLIMIILKLIQETFPDKELFVFYTEADEYFPKIDEKDEILELSKKRDDESILKISERLQASGARETLIPVSFKGTFKEDFPIALIFLVGYEPARDIGLLETYRPNIVIPCYGTSPHEKFSWRTQFAINLHKNFAVFDEFSRLKEDKIISTFDIPKILVDLENIYNSEIEGNILFETFNVAITPQCSKLQAVATFLFCKKHPDVQAVFCLPGKFNPNRYSIGIGKSWYIHLV